MADTAPPTAGAELSDELAGDAFVYAYPMVEAYAFFHRTMVETGYPLNRFQNIRSLADDTYTAHPTINNDTLHLMGWLDVAAEPVVVSVPDMDEGRYWILHVMDMGHYTSAMIGSRLRGTRGGAFMFASHGWDGPVPSSVTEVVRVDSDLVKLMGRIMATGPRDEVTAREHMDKWNVRTLSEYLGEKGPAPVERSYPDPARTNWLEIACFVLQHGSLAAQDAHWLDQLDGTGLQPGRTDFTAGQLDAAKRGKELGMRRIEELAPTLSDSRRLLGTRAALGDGDRDAFAVGTYLGQWGLPPVEAVYTMKAFDASGAPLDGSGGRSYRFRIPRPDVSEFWSLTVYASDNRLMAHNALNRHSRGDRTLHEDADGTFTIDLGPDSTGREDDPGFLPVPEKQFYVILRLYGPDEEMQRGDYRMPDLEPVG
ncbi:DUF1254 domain-containing protein [Kitasatospora phosalacinea]|uniref:DUF1254 domain-containing protein n=1 Tax=Kitasatospora phosalacinea TaxID=2065 RepID=UPI003657E46C